MNINNCYTGTAIEQLEEGCAGDYTSTDCTQTPNAISYLDLPAGSSQTEINAALTASLLFKDQQIAEFSSTAIEAGDNIEVTGVGSEENPYIVSSTGGAQDLQSVIDNGGYAEKDGGNSYIDVLGGNLINSRYIDMTISNGAYDNTQLSSTLNIEKDRVSVVNVHGGNEDTSRLVIGNGILELHREATEINKKTVITFIRPVVEAIVKFPAKINSGEYTISAYPNMTYLVSTLPAGQLNDIAVVTDASTPTYLGALAGGGTTVTPVWHNGTIWVAR